MRFQLWHAPVRLATGAYILDAGLHKWSAEDDEYHKHVHEMAVRGYPQFASMEPRSFTRLLAAGEIALGAALLAPPISPALAGAGLAAFSGGLLGLYARIPAMREPGSIRPSSQGLALAKDSWMFAIGVALVIDGISQRTRRLLKVKR